VHPVILVVSRNRTIRGEPIVKPGVLLVPSKSHGRVKELSGPRYDPFGGAIPLDLKKKLAPFDVVPGLIAPRSKKIVRLVAVKIPVNGPVGAIVFPYQPVGLNCPVPC
jgi:hypothetical protein